jgi:hypothetical protein
VHLKKDVFSVTLSKSLLFALGDPQNRGCFAAVADLELLIRLAKQDTRENSCVDEYFASVVLATLKPKPAFHGAEQVVAVSDSEVELRSLLVVLDHESALFQEPRAYRIMISVDADGESSPSFGVSMYSEGAPVNRIAWLSLPELVHLDDKRPSFDWPTPLGR